MEPTFTLTESIGILKFFGEGPSDNHVNVAEVDDGGVEELRIGALYADLNSGTIAVILTPRTYYRGELPQASRQLFSNLPEAGGHQLCAALASDPLIPQSIPGAYFVRARHSWRNGVS